MKKTCISLLPVLLLLLASCKSAIKTAVLYGKWKYIKVEHPSANPPDSLSSAELQSQTPSIEFLKSNQYLINWGGKVLSHGKFAVNGMNIQITEDLPDGTTRAFPFWVSELTGTEIIFETKGEEGSKVTALKQ
ncbi:hypothetical protein [Mucilaginibacter sp.]|uniref:hypothetical protein n=1 Tax=Mucilaginibacter sp. TaxID=1882438 RepID=UPI003D0F32BD